MPDPLIAAIEWGKLAQVVWVSILAGVGVTLMYSLVIFGGARAAEARRDKRASAATAFLGLAILAFALFAAGVAFGISVMLNK